MTRQRRLSRGRVLTDRQNWTPDPAALIDALKPTFRLSPAAPQITLGCFQRDRRTILLLVNIGCDPYVGKLSAVRRRKPWTCLDPRTGAVASVAVDAAGFVPLRLDGRRALILVE